MAPRSSLPPSSKKRKHADSSDEEKVTAKVATIEAQLIKAATAKSSLNPLADLLDLALNATEAQILSKTIWALYRVFVVVITNDLLLNVAGSEESKAVRLWLQEKLNSYVKLLVGLMKDEEEVLKVCISLNYMLLWLKNLPPSLKDFSLEDSTLFTKAPLDLRQ